MGTFKNNELTGLVGELVVYKTKYGSFFRRRPKRNKPPTEAEKKVRYIFGMINKWLQPIAPFVRRGFRDISDKCGGRQSAVSRIYKNGLEKNGFDSIIHPEQVFVSWGRLGLPEEVTVQLNEEQELEFQWSTEVGPTQDPRDRVMLLAYDTLSEKATWDLNGPQRIAGAAKLSLKLMSAGTYHIYLAFAAADEKGQSVSTYLGAVVR